MGFLLRFIEREVMAENFLTRIITPTPFKLQL